MAIRRDKIIKATILLGVVLLFLGLTLSSVYLGTATVNISIEKMEILTSQGWKTVTSYIYGGESPGTGYRASAISVSIQAPGVEEKSTQRIAIGGEEYEVYSWDIKFDVAVTVTPKTKNDFFNVIKTDPTEAKIYVKISSSYQGYYLFYAICEDIRIEGVSPNDLNPGWSWMDILDDYLVETVLYTPKKGSGVTPVGGGSYPTTIEEFKNSLSLPQKFLVHGVFSGTVIRDHLTGAMKSSETTVIYTFRVTLVAWQVYDPDNPNYTPIDDPAVDVGYKTMPWWVWIIVGIVVLLLVVVLIKSFASPRVVVVKK